MKPESELDEIWSFVFKKARKRWVWIALCRNTGQIVAFVTGDRGAVTCRKLWQQIPALYRPEHCYTDGKHIRKLFPQVNIQLVVKTAG